MSANSRAPRALSIRIVASRASRPGPGPRVRSVLGLAAALVLMGSGLAVGASSAIAAPLVGAEIELLEDGTAHGTANECLVTDPDSSLADEGPGDGIVCTDDSVLFGWNYSVAADGADEVVFRQTLPAGWTWDPISLTACAGGADYAGSGVISADGLTLTCTVDFPDTQSARSGVIPVRAIPQPGIPDGSVYAAVLTVEDDGAAVTVPPAQPVTVRSQPRWNLSKGTAGISYGQEADFGSGLEPAVSVSFWSFISAVTSNNFKGQDSLAGPIAYWDQVADVDAEALLQACSTAGGGTTTTCSQPGGPGTPVQIVLPDGMPVPETSVNPGAGPAVGYYGSISLLVPLRNVPVYPDTSTVMNQFTDFDPMSSTGTSNLGSGVETGSEAGAECVSGNGNDNCAPVNLTTQYFPPGIGWAAGKSLRQKTGQPACGGHWWWCEPLEGTTGTSSNNDGSTGNQDGVAYRDQAFWAGFSFSWNPGLETIPTNVVMCDVWDPALQQFDPDGMTGTTLEAWWSSVQGDVEFTDAVYADDAARESASCGTWGDSAAGGPWYADHTDVPGGADAVTGVRWRVPVDRVTNQVWWVLPMEVDDSVAAGTIVPDFAHVYMDELVDPSTNPDGTSWVARDSYRVNDLQLLLDKDTVPAGTTGSVAGARVPFSLDVSANLFGTPGSARPLDGLHVVDTLDPCLVEAQLDPSVTEWSMSIAAGDTGPDGLACTDDDVSGATLTFTPIAPFTTDSDIEQILYSVVVSSFVDNGQDLRNTAVVLADPGVTLQTEGPRTDEWELTVAAPGAVRVSKVADFPLVEIEPDDLSWTITYANTLLTDLGQTQFIDVLPYNGDGRGTDFAGTFRFAGAEVVAGVDTTVYYTLDPVSTIDPDPATNTSSWVAADAFAGDPAAVTAIRIVADDLSRGESGAVRIHADPEGNEKGDVYGNQVAAGRATGLTQPVPATLVSEIRVVASSVGDRVWFDANADGVQDAGETGFEGVTLRLLDSGGSDVATTVTGADGLYSFDGLHSGDYRIVVDPATLPAGFEATYDLDGGVATPDSDSGVFGLGIDTDRTDVDFGYVRMAPGVLTVEKIVEDAGAGWFGEEQEFAIEVTCVTDGVVEAGFPQTLTFEGSGSQTVAAPIGATCTAEETDDGGATSSSVDPAEGVLITADAGATFSIAVENVFEDGSLVIVKALTGAGAEEFGDGPFTFSVECTYEGRTVHESEVVLERDADGTTLTSDPIDGLPIGSECIVEETDAGGADETAPPVTVTIASSTTAVSADLTNRFSAGTISLAKEVDGPGAGSAHALGTVYTVLVTCQIESVDAEGDPVRATLHSEEVDLVAGETVPLMDADGDPVLLPLGARCFGEETETGGATEVDVDHGSWEDGAEVTAGSPDDLQSLTITAVNTFEVAEFIVSKTVTGAGSPGPYTFIVSCVTETGEYLLPEEDASFQLSHGETRTIAIAPGVSCGVLELDAPETAVVSYLDSDPSSEGGTTDGIVYDIVDVGMVDVTNAFPPAPPTPSEPRDPNGLTVTGSDPRLPLLAAFGLVLLGLLAVGIVAIRRRRPE